MGHSHHHHGEHADGWTKASAAGELISNLISDTYWIGTSLDGILRLTTLAVADMGIGLSPYGLGVGLAITIVSAIGSAYCHSILNITHQEEQTEQKKTDGAKEQTSTAVSLSWLQKIALAGDFISHTGNIAGPFSIVDALITTKLSLPPYSQVITQCGATLFGGAASIANLRTCRNSMLALNRLEALQKKEDATESPQLDAEVYQSVCMPIII